MNNDNLNSCTKRARAMTGASLIGMVALVLGLGFSQNALAVSAGAAVLPVATTNLTTGLQFNATIRVQNASVEDDNVTDVPAVLKAGSTLTVILACADTACTTELPGTLEFLSTQPPSDVQIQGNGCVTSVAGVGSCVANGNNRVDIHIASDISLPAGGPVNVASIRLLAKTPVLNPQSGQFSQRAASGPNDIEACSVLNPSDCATGGGEGSKNYFFPGACDVEIDKQLSCDGGMTWVDAANAAGDPNFVKNNEDGTFSCATLNPNPIMARYNVRNSGDFDLAQCTFGETNGAFGVAAVPDAIAAGASTGFINAPNMPLCKDASGGEPNTASISCLQCGSQQLTADTAIKAHDKAQFTCEEIELLTDRAVSCDGEPFSDETRVMANDDGTLGCTTEVGKTVTWKYQAENKSNLPLYNCELQDQNPLVSPAPIPVDTLNAGQLIENIPATLSQFCSADLQASEEHPKGRVDLACCSQNKPLAECEPPQRVQVFDISTVTCLSPDLNVTKDCTTDSLNLASWGITVTNTGEVDYVACEVEDRILENMASCEGVTSGKGGVLVDSDPNGFMLAAGGSQPVTGSHQLTSDSCNTVSVTCTTEAGTEVPRFAKDECEFEEREGCLTRTPGFWATHPHVTAEFLEIEVCGTTLDNVNAGNGHSAIEAMCSVGRDGRILGPQLTQLVRQCTAAALNIAASQELGGNCSSDFPGIDTTFAACCGGESICTGETVGDYSVESCITALDFFNNTDPDTLNFSSETGPAQPKACQDSRNNGIVVVPGKG